MAVPYTFGSATSSIPLSQLDSNFATGITLGNTTVYLGNTTTSFGNVTLTNVTISSVSTAITPSQGGTGLVTIPANNVILGNGTSNVTVVAPGTSGNVLTSNGTTWSSSTISAASVSAAGSTTQVQYNNGGAFAGSANLTFNGTTLTAAGLSGPLNGTVGATTPSTGAFTTLSASSTVSGTGFSTYLASPPAIGGTAAAAGSFTTLSASSDLTLSGGTANGVTYLNGSKVLTSGSALTFDGTTVLVNASNPILRLKATADTQSSIIQFGDTSSNFSGVINYDHSVDAMQFYTATQERIRIDSSGNVGIGTSSPDTKLDVASGNAEAIRLSSNSYLSTGQGPWIGFDGGPSASWNMARIQATRAGTEFQGNLLFFTNNSTTDGTAATEKMRLDSAGNLGLGVTPSAWTTWSSVLQGNAYALTGYNNSGNVQSALWTNAYNGSGGVTYYSNGYATQYKQYNGNHAWSTAASGTAGNAISFTQAMTLDASGHLNIGITSGSSDTVLYANESANATRYVVMANGNTGSSAAAVFNASAGSGGDGRLWAYGINHSTQANNVALYNHNGSGSLLLGTVGTERARIDSSGNFCYGVNSFSAASNGFLVTANGSSTYTAHANGTSSGATYSFFYYNNSVIGSITQSGTTAVLYNVTSDYRLKNVIGAVTGHGERLDALEPVEYEWKADGSRTRGFLAHKFQEVYAGSVTGTKDAVDADGNPVYQAMQAGSSEVIADLVAEIKSLRQRLAAANL